MPRVNFFRTTIGKKVVMAVTGLIGLGYLIVHVAGNLQAVVGQDKLDGYAAALHGPLDEITWLVRIILLAAVILHVWSAWSLTQEANAARPVGYGKKEPQVSTLAARTMRWGGVFLLAFIVFHILHFTLKMIDPAGWAHTHDAEGRYDIYGNVVHSFRIWWVTLIYLAAMAFLFLHLFHGAWSSVRTLGYAKPSAHPLRRRIALVVALAITVGFTLVPVGVLLGLIR